MIRYLCKILCFLALSFAAHADYDQRKMLDLLELPGSVRSKAVFHIRAHQLDEFSCGYNALFNACNLEKVCGFPNRFSDYALFKKACMSYLRQKGLHPRSASTSDVLETLAYNHLGMQDLYSLSINEENRIVPHFSTPTEVIFDARTSEWEVQQLFKKAYQKRVDQCFESIKKQLQDTGPSYRVVHFICYTNARGVPHGILLSIVAHRTGKGLYIWDNMNLEIKQGSQAMRYIDFLCNTFALQSQAYYQRPTIPQRWASVPRHAMTFEGYAY